MLTYPTAWHFVSTVISLFICPDVGISPLTFTAAAMAASIRRWEDVDMI